MADDDDGATVVCVDTNVVVAVTDASCTAAINARDKRERPSGDCHFCEW